MKIKIGSRASKLALWQANFIKTKLEVLSGINVEIIVIKTKGDKMLEARFSEINDKGLFTKEIETALASREIDIAVHSMKDLPVELPEGLMLGAIPEREIPNDALVSKFKLGELPSGAKIGTGSIRRMAQILNFRKDIMVKDIRGNIDTRLRKMETLGFDGIIVACAGLKRLNLLSRVSEIIPFEIMLPAPGQGAIAVEIRKGDKKIHEVVSNLNDNNTFKSVTAERSLLTKISQAHAANNLMDIPQGSGGCQVPMGALAFIKNGRLKLKAMISNLNGAKIIKGEIEGRSSESKKLGEKLAEKLLSEMI